MARDMAVTRTLFLMYLLFPSLSLLITHYIYILYIYIIYIMFIMYISVIVMIHEFGDCEDLSFVYLCHRLITTFAASLRVQSGLHINHE